METDAAVLRQSNGPFEAERVVLDGPSFGEVLVRVVGAGVCHTDLAARTRPDGVTTPIILGHEGAGVIEQIGPGVSGLAPGDSVVMSFESCGACGPCRSGHPAYCDNFGAVNMGRRADGSPGAHDLSGAEIEARFFGQSSFARHALATVRNVVKVDSGLPLELLGTLGCGIQTGAATVMVAMGVRLGESLAVFGAGAVGLSAIMAARAVGAANIIAVDLHAARRDLALELGATHVYDGADPDVVAQIRAAVPAGVEYALDTTGVSSVIVAALGCLSNTGLCGLVAVGGDVVLPNNALAYGKKLAFMIEGDAVPQLFIPHMIRLWQQGRFPFDRLIKTYPLDQINQAVRDSGEGRTVKPVLV